MLVVALAAPVAVMTAPAYATGSTLYVNDATGSNCSDTAAGHGSQATPYCTVQAALNAVQPGQTIQSEVSSEYPENDTLTRSGSSASPITLSGIWLNSLTLSGVHDVVVTGSSFDTSLQTGMIIDNSSRITVDRDGFTGGVVFAGHPPQVAIKITGKSSAVTVSRTAIEFAKAGGIEVDAGVTGTVITTNYLEEVAGPAISVISAPDTAVTSNTITWPCASAISLTGTSSGSFVENNISVDTDRWTTGMTCSAEATYPDLMVSAGSAPDTTVSHNIFAPTSYSEPYTWAGTEYATPTAFQTATGQGTDDLLTNPQFDSSDPFYSTVLEGSPAIDSADPTAPGELSTDFFGAARVSDPMAAHPVADTFDRGAFEYTKVYQLGSSVAVDRQSGFAPMTVTASAPVTNPESLTVSYSFDFGDGSAPVVTDVPTAQHTYSQPYAGNGGGYPVTVTATLPNGTSLSSTQPARVAVATPDPYVPFGPTRILDTRSGIGWSGSSPVVPAGGSASVAVEGNGSIPKTGVTAVVMNVTVTNTSGSGYLTAWADGTARPTTSNLNWGGKGQAVSNLVTVPVGGDGRVDLYTSGPASIIGDVQGYYTTDASGSAASTFTSTAPARLLDTRQATGISTAGAITNGTVSLNVAGQDGVPADATAVVLNLTATGTTGGGFLEAYPEGARAPGVSNVNWTAAKTTVAGLAVVPLGADGHVSIKVAGTSQVVADVFGYFTAGSGGSQFTAVAPNRLLDTRAAIGIPTRTPIAAGHDLVLQITGRAGVPAGITSVVLNVTATGNTSGGVLQAWADGTPRPSTSNLNWAPGQTIANQVVVPVAPDGKVDLYVTGTTHVIADIFGYYM
ncbi:PKD domain-containing protein [Streptacidiphilus sp. PB12-B1b]|uniref:right-handed parallel beta-helix repeat-containing protein n=1 Tax=Streptacidiphilus sp. PB12-B1b TaxID=2705012 RepID=UPI0015F86D69|nr:right-handed parallel beta-helix repeat-containing protein [Streptacidiphilus sp. PB12-B1b]QMU79498.1 PKD domain-containing protein [Streptacidiphilus sp. PB12-B1b]